MESISFRLDVFEGPLDLLLDLISKHKLDICDIEISKLLEQYLLYIDRCHEQDLELAGEFLEMAARLIYIKTASLLPHPEEAERMKKELEGTLIEYSVCKKAAARLAENYIGGEIFVREPAKIETDKVYSVTHEPEALAAAYAAVAVRKAKISDGEADIEEKINSVVSHKVVSVLSGAVHVLRQLYKSGKADIDELLDEVTDRSARVATFLAVLELTKSGRIGISDDNSVIFFKGRKDDERRSWRSEKSLAR